MHCTIPLYTTAWKRFHYTLPPHTSQPVLKYMFHDERREWDPTAATSVMEKLCISIAHYTTVLEDYLRTTPPHTPTTYSHHVLPDHQSRQIYRAIEMHQWSALFRGCQAGVMGHSLVAVLGAAPQSLWVRFPPGSNDCNGFFHCKEKTVIM